MTFHMSSKNSSSKKKTKTNGKKANGRDILSAVLLLTDSNVKVYLQEIESQWDTVLPGSQVLKQPGQIIGKLHPFAVN